jgi:tetratricopeptide (TPR) repeat protein
VAQQPAAVAYLNATLPGDDPAVLDQALAELDRALAAMPGEGVALHYKGYALYRKASLLLGNASRRTEYQALLREADRTLERSAAGLRWPETLALRSAVIGQLIGASGGLSALKLGPRANRLMAQAMELDSLNPRVWLLRGVSALYKPKVFGGGLENAERDLTRAIQLFEGDEARPPHPAWGHAEAWAWLGKVYADRRLPSHARSAYDRALALAPDFVWVRDYLLPRAIAEQN